MLNTHPQARPAQGPGLGHPKQRPRPHLRASRPGSAAHPASPAALVPARLQAPSCPHAVCLVTRGWLSTQGSAHRCPAGPSQPLPGCPGFAGLQAKGSRFCLPSAGHEKLPCGRSPARRQTCAPCSASEHGVPAWRPSPGRPAVRQALLSGLCMPELAPPARGQRPGSLPPGALPTRDKIVQWLRLQSPAAPVQSPAALPRSAGRPWAGNSLPQFPP